MHHPERITNNCFNFSSELGVLACFAEERVLYKALTRRHLRLGYIRAFRANSNGSTKD